MLIGPGNLGGQVDLLGAGLLLGSSFIWAFASLLSGRLSRPASALQSASLNLLCGGALLMTGSLLIGEWSHINLAAVSVKSLLAVAYLSTMGSAVAFAAYMWLLTVVPANRVVTYAYVNPVIAVFLGWALAGETITANTIIAAAVIITAVVLITSAPTKPVTVSTPQP
ncbi:MAG TPA: EamA family transporter, partial [Phototrophicaceae bacterium]|nr:EamA family transporter [Phototrophicaceae bacterium]